MWLTRPTFLPLCGYPVEEAPAAALMNVPADLRHSAQLPPQAEASRLFADKLGELIHKKDIDEFGHELNYIVQLKHGLMMSLSGPNVKAGKRGCPASPVLAK
jgi:hypothetical protein